MHMLQKEKQRMTKELNQDITDIKKVGVKEP